MRRSDFRFTYPLLAAFALFSFHPHAIAADLGRSVIPQLQERFGMSEAQVRGSLGALLIFVRERLPKPEFDRVSRSIPNAERIMRETRLNGIVTGPLDHMGDYQASLASLVSVSRSRRTGWARDPGPRSCRARRAGSRRRSARPSSSSAARR